VVELVKMLEGLESVLNTLRLEIHNRSAQLGVARRGENAEKTPSGVEKA
jgi:hypothetical protein